MNQKRMILISLVVVTCLGAGGFWVMGKPGSQCEAFTQANEAEKAFPVCLIAARKGDAYAQNIIGVSYASGDGVALDSKAALLWFRKSAAQGFAKAQSNLGLAYLDGAGVSRDQAAANHWWTLAAAQGEPHAQFNLAVSLGNGYGINQNTE
ncbi:MAG: tetratricopeptide repeat protein, partial [Mariprofundus sp.]|nr:tetratricopeptide repeat protein [Mariprofundus sp.]